jgi:hypothetical protein
MEPELLMDDGLAIQMDRQASRLSLFDGEASVAAVKV